MEHKTTGSKPHRLLRNRIKACGLLGQDIARKLHCAPGTLSDKLNAKRHWLSWEMHALMDIIDAEPEEMYELFPPDGIEVPPVRKACIEKYLADRNETAVSTPVLETMAALMRTITKEAM